MSMMMMIITEQLSTINYYNAKQKNRVNQSKTKQNKTQQNITKHNKTKHGDDGAEVGR